MYTGNRGYYRVKNPHKYIGDINNVVYRSNWELKFMRWVDDNPNIVGWASETTIIPYINDMDNSIHRYFVDFFLKIKQSDGNIVKYLVEVKPEKFTRPPTQPKKKSKKYLEEVVQYITNESKWKAANKYCNERGMKFIILTEKHLGIKK